MLLDHVNDSPFELFEQWFSEAARHEHIGDHTEMLVATASKQGVPSARIVLLKGLDERGFVFYTNLSSHKSRDLHENPVAEINFYWHPQYRQVRISGNVEQVSAAESDAYFASREREKQIGAYASRQSQPLASREAFDAHYAEIEARFEGQPIPRPDFWGGWRVVPQKMEFWQGHPMRLHDRILFTRNADDTWRSTLVNP